MTSIDDDRDDSFEQLRRQVQHVISRVGLLVTSEEDRAVIQELHRQVTPRALPRYLPPDADRWLSGRAARLAEPAARRRAAAAAARHRGMRMTASRGVV